MATVVVVTAMVACSKGDDDDGGSAARRDTTEATESTPTSGAAESTTEATLAPTTTAGPTTTRPATPEAQIAVDYLAYWTAYERLAADPSGDAGILSEHASGQALDGARQDIEELRAHGQRTEHGPLEQHNAYAPAVIDAETAYIADCHVADAQIVDARGRAVTGVQPGGRAETIAVTLVRRGDRWLVDSLEYYDLAPNETCSADGPVAG